MTDEATRKALEYALEQWGRQNGTYTAARDALVYQAATAGIPKHRIHVLTGIARTTIDRILAGEQR